MIQDIAFTGNMDAGLKWTIKNKAKHIAELSTVDAFMARLVKIKDAVINEKMRMPQCSTRKVLRATMVTWPQ